MLSYLSPKQFADIFNDFCKQTRKSGCEVYKKLPYNDWSEIKRNFVGKCVTLEYCDDSDTIILSTNDHNEIEVDSSDNSFGSYLFDNCFTEVTEMMYSDSSSSTTYKKNSIPTSYYGDYDDGNVTCSRKNDYEMATLKKDVKTKMEERENKKDMKGFNFDFGPCTNDNIKMSIYGLAVQNNAGVWVSYNAKEGTIIDVDILNFDGRKYMFKMPVAVKEIKKGDIIVHNRIPMFVIDTENGIMAVDVRAGEEKKIIPTTNMFGFNFVTKIVSMFDAMGSAPTPDAPFGNMLPLMLMTDDGKDFDPAMLMLMMGSNGAGTGFDMSNPMMLYFLMKDGKGSDMLPLMFLMNNKPAGN